MWMAPLGSTDSALNMDVPKNITQAQRDNLIKWFYDQKYRPFHREVADYARQQLGITIANHVLAKIIRDSSPPPGSKPQLWKSKFQAAGSSKSNKFDSPIPHSTGSAFANRNAWQFLCDEHLLDPEVHHVPPSATDAATASPVRHVELNVHSTFNFGKKALTNSDISALLLHATGTISAVTCDNCLKNQGVFNGCVVQAPGGPCAAKFNNSCSNCWFGGRANQCSLRQGLSTLSHHRVLAAQDRKSAPTFRRRESTSSEDESNNRRFTVSGILPKGADSRDDHERHRAKRRRTLRATAETNGRRKPQSMVQNDADKAEGGDGESALRNRTSQATSHWQETVPTGEGPDLKSVLDPGDMTRYLNHYMKYYATMTKGERTRERVLRNLELVAIDALNASGK